MSRKTAPDSVGVSLERHLGSADGPLAALARRLAARIDAPETPAYAIARLTSELRAVLAELEGRAPPRNGHPYDPDA